VRAEALSTANAGMTRLRRKGNASPATLYDLLNAYITISGSIKPRPGTIVHTTLPADTKGLIAHNGKLVVFSHQPVTMTDSNYENVVLRHPSDSTVKVRDIHFAQPFMGYLYVVAGFEDGQQWHYWVEVLDPWRALNKYDISDRVFPTIPNGFAYKAKRINPANPVWAKGVERSLNDVIEPTSYNGFNYTCVAVTGTSPASGDIEPVWPENDGERITEMTAGQSETDYIPEFGGDTDPLDPIDDRYLNPGGSRPIIRTER